MNRPLKQALPIHGWTIKYELYEPKSHVSGSLSLSEKTLVFVHGTPWSSKVFVPMAEAISATYRCRILLYDLPGYGQSQSFKSSASTQSDKNGFVGDTSVKAQASALANLLEVLKLDGRASSSVRPTLIAHDIAGTIALRAHLFHGCEFDSLVLLDTNAVLPWGDGMYKLIRSQPQVFTELPLPIFEAVVRAMTKSAIHQSSKAGSAWEDAMAEPWIVCKETQCNFVRQIAQANDADVAEMLDQNMYERVRCDVKILWGEEDQRIPREKMERLVGLLGDRLKSFVVVPHAGHLLMIDRPERVVTEIAAWLTRR